MPAKDKCPSCFQPVSPTDFLCANCELILAPSQAPERPNGEVSVVRRMLEVPQRGLPSNKPNPRPQKSGSREGPTRKLDLGPELSGVPVVVATLTGLSLQLSEFEAFVVSLIDGLSDAVELAKVVGVRELELRVVLRTLQDQHIIDFADEPLSDDDLEMPAVLGALDDEMTTMPGLVVPSIAPAMGASSARRDGRFVSPPSLAASVQAVPPVPASSPSAPLNEREGRLIRAGRAAVPPPPPLEAFEQNIPPPLPKAERTDPRIAYSGTVNRKVLDALKKVRRAENPAPVSTPKEDAGLPVADLLARDTLQVALRMEQGGRLDEAIRFLEKSIAQSPEAASLYNRLGIILMRERGDFRRAETLIRKAIELAPDNRVYATNLQQVLSRHAVRTGR